MSSRKGAIKYGRDAFCQKLPKVLRDKFAIMLEAVSVGRLTSSESNNRFEATQVFLFFSRSSTQSIVLMRLHSLTALSPRLQAHVAQLALLCPIYSGSYSNTAFSLAPSISLPPFMSLVFLCLSFSHIASVHYIAESRSIDTASDAITEHGWADRNTGIGH